MRINFTMEFPNGVNLRGIPIALVIPLAKPWTRRLDHEQIAKATGFINSMDLRALTQIRMQKTRVKIMFDAWFSNSQTAGWKTIGGYDKPSCKDDVVPFMLDAQWIMVQQHLRRKLWRQVCSYQKQITFVDGLRLPSPFQVQVIVFETTPHSRCQLKYDA